MTIANGTFGIETKNRNRGAVMRSKSPELMEKIWNFVGEYYRHNYISPTIRIIAEEMGISKSTAHGYLVEMDEKGMLSYRNGVLDDLPKINKTPTGIVSAPLVGSISCGNPETEEEQVEMYVGLPEVLIGKGEYYLLKAAGDSMEDAGIEEGDLIVIRSQKTAAVGDIVVALDDTNQNTLKKFTGFDEEHHAILAYMNEKKYPGKTIRVNHLAVQGVAKKVLKDL